MRAQMLAWRGAVQPGSCLMLGRYLLDLEDKPGSLLMSLLILWWYLATLLCSLLVDLKKRSSDTCLTCFFLGLGLAPDYTCNDIKVI